jgi:hypothetical protein
VTITKDEFFRICEELPFNENGCQIWTGPIYRGQRQGYPRVYLGRNYPGSNCGNRLILERKLKRPIKPGYLACHTCDTPACVNQDHIFEGTFQDNVLDAKKKGRMYKQFYKRGIVCT